MAGEITVCDRTEVSDWDEALWRQRCANVFAAIPWGTYKTRQGWLVRRIALRDAGGADLAYVQYQQRRVGPGRLTLVQGGPVLTERGQAHVEGVVAALVDHLALRLIDLLVVNPFRFHDPEGLTALLAHRFTPVVTRQDHTIELDLSTDTAAILANANRKWRREVGKAEGNADLTTAFLVAPDERARAFDAFERMYAELQRRKGFKSRLNAAAYRDLAVADTRLVFVEIRERDEPILVRIVHTAHERWTDFYTASNDRARATGAATLAVWRIVERARQEGAGFFDFGGVDPADNRGVFDFKRGLSQNVVQSGPLWVYAHHRVVRTGAATLLGLRGA